MRVDYKPVAADKKPGVVYVANQDGVELPVLDVTHDVFRIDLSEAELSQLTEQFIADAKKRAKMPAFLTKLFYRVVLRSSVLGGAIRGATGTFVSGMNTYLMKLGPDNLGSNASEIDRKIAGSLPALTMRLRLQDIAHLIAAGDRKSVV